jgi:hypothetical protein
MFVCLFTPTTCRCENNQEYREQVMVPLMAEMGVTTIHQYKERWLKSEEGQDAEWGDENLLAAFASVLKCCFVVFTVEYPEQPLMVRPLEASADERGVEDLPIVPVAYINAAGEWWGKWLCLMAG